MIRSEFVGDSGIVSEQQIDQLFNIFVDIMLRVRNNGIASIDTSNIANTTLTIVNDYIIYGINLIQNAYSPDVIMLFLKSRRHFLYKDLSDENTLFQLLLVEKFIISIQVKDFDFIFTVGRHMPH